VEEHVVPLTRHTVQELEKVGIQAKAIGADLAYGRLMAKDKKGKPKTIISLQYEVWDSLKQLGKSKLLSILLTCIGSLSSLPEHEVLTQLESVKFTCWFKPVGVKENCTKPDLSEYDSRNILGTSSTDEHMCDHTLGCEGKN
jgi:hypothetical protein